MDGGKLYGAISARAYRRRFDRAVESHRERSLQKVDCELCGAVVNRQELKKHQATRKCANNRKDYRATTSTTVADESDEEPLVERTPSEYRVGMDAGQHVTPCPVEGCPACPGTADTMRRHFRNMHNKDTIIIEGEGRLPRCGNCGLFQRNVGPKHQQSQDCIRWTNAFQKRMEDSVNKETVRNMVFTVGGGAIENVTEFKYLGRVVKKNDDDWPTVNRNIRRAQSAWGSLRRILSREGAEPRAMATIYKAVVQAVLLYGSETWVLSLAMEKKLNSFHHCCARYITGQHIRQNPDESWTCPSSKDVLAQAGLWTIKEYVRRRRNTVTKDIGARFIYRQCETSLPLASNPNQLVWWKPGDAGNLLDPDS